MGDEKWQKWHEIMSLQGEEVSVEEAAGKRILRLVQALRCAMKTRIRNCL